MSKTTLTRAARERAAPRELWLFRLVAGLAVALATLVWSAAASAQTADEQSAYVALIYTPVAGLPPLAPVALSAAGKDTAGVLFQGRLGHMSRRGGLSLTTYGIGVEAPMGRARLGATLAYLSASCGQFWAGETDCAGDVMLGGNLRATLKSMSLSSSEQLPKGRRASRASNEGSLVIGFDGSVGYSPRAGEQAMSVAAGLPTAVVLGSGDLKVMPFVTPGVGYGRLGNVVYCDCGAVGAFGDMAFMLGGGVGLQFGSSGMGATLGFQKVFKSDGGTTQFGLGMTWQGPTAKR
jgi:hypothetical protein